MAERLLATAASSASLGWRVAPVRAPADEWWVNLFYVFAALTFGVLGYREAKRFAGATGRAPWGLPPAVWAVLLAASLLLGGLLLLVARRTTRPAATAPVPPGVAGPTGPADNQPSWGR